MRRLPLVSLVFLAACSSVEGTPTSVPSTSTTTATTTTSVPASTTSSVAPTTTVPPSSTPQQVSTGWQVTVYYTAVETFHSGATRQVRGCPKIDCENGDDDLGTYPASFAQAVEDEGTGRTRSGKYLNWSHDKGYWLDTAPRDTNGKPLQPFVSAAADGVPQGSHIRFVSCGQLSEGGAVDAKVCEKFKASTWVISDAFTPGLGGARHIDLYLGEENGPRFTESAWYTTFAQAVLQIS